MKNDSNLFARGLPLAGLIFAFAPTLTTSAATPPDYAPTGCRITRDRIGIYEEPNTRQEARGLLEKDVTVLLGQGSGDGWARIVRPETGWVQAKFLKGNRQTSCPESLRPPTPTPPPVPPRPPLPAPGSTQPSKSPVDPRLTSAAQAGRSRCAVIPEAGLLVRDTPVLASSRIIGQIRSGEHTFQFTDRRVESETPEGLRQWVYITAPAKGWISTGFVNGGSNLSGENCP